MSNIKVVADRPDIVAIADVIRDKTGATAEMFLSEMPDKVQEVYNAGVEAGKASVTFKDRFKELIDYRDAKYLFYGKTDLATSPLAFGDTENATNMSNMFNGCTALTTIPKLSYENVTDMSSMFKGCTALVNMWGTTFNTKNVLTMANMFQNCTALVSAQLMNTECVRSIASMFANCTNLTTIPKFDLRNTTQTSAFCANCSKLTKILVKNIKTSLQVGSGSSWGHLITQSCLIYLIQQLIATGAALTLTVGSANLTKLANVYVKLIDITNEMREEDDLIDSKYPFEVCESTDEGAMLITDYASTYKAWTIK